MILKPIDFYLRVSKIKFLEILAVIFLTLLAPVSKLIAFNREYFGLTVLEYIIVVSVISLILSIPFIVLSLWKTARSWINLCLSLLLIVSTLTSFVIPINSGAIDSIKSSALEVRSEAFVALILTIATFFCLMILARLWPKYFEKIAGAISLLKLFSVVYASAFFIYAVASGPISFSFSGEEVSPIKAPISKNRNIFIISFDQVQGSAMRGYLDEHPDYAGILDGFTSYSDAAATYPNTNHSLGSVWLGRIAKKQSEGNDYAISSGDSILAVVEGKGFSIKTNDYLRSERYDCVTCGPPSFNFVKSYELLRHAINLGFGVDIVKLGMTLPKTFYGTTPSELVDHAWRIDLQKFQQFSQSMVVSEEKPPAYFMHFRGTHQPFIYNGDCTLKTLDEISKTQNFQSATEQIDSVFLMLEKFIGNLKELGVYDNSLIIVLSDHGYEDNINSDSNSIDHESYFPKASAEFGDLRNIKPVGSYNPFLFFKPEGSRGDLILNDSPVSLIDIAPTICDAIGCESQWAGISLFKDVSGRRVREFWQYIGGSDRRAPDGSDKLHDGLDKYWEMKSFEGPIYPNLAFAMGLPKESFLKLYTLGEPIHFKTGGRSIVYAISGWYDQEAAAQWTVGKEAKLRFKLNKQPGANLILKMNASPFLCGSITQQLIRVVVNKVEVASWIMRESDWYETEIPLKLVKNGVLDIVFHISHPTAPCDVTADTKDARKLGVAVRELVIMEKVTRK